MRSRASRAAGQDWIGSKTVYRYVSVGVILVLGSLMGASAQQVDFAEPIKEPSLTSQQSALLSTIRNTPTTRTVELIRLNLSALVQNRSISIRTQAKDAITINYDSSEFNRDGSLVAWRGAVPHELDKTTSMAINGQNVTASIRTTDGFYRIRPLGDGLHALIKVDPGKLPPEHPPATANNRGG